MAKTMREFNDTFNQEDACYIYFFDCDWHMKFLADVDSVNLDAADVNDAIYTDNMSDAVLCTTEQAKTLKFLCDYLFPKHHHHIVRICSSVEWL